MKENVRCSINSKVAVFIPLQRAPIVTVKKDRSSLALVLNSGAVNKAVIEDKQQMRNLVEMMTYSLKH